MVGELEVVQHAPDKAGYAIVAAPHPLYGGSLDNPVVEALAAGFRAAGVGTLCFNYRGIGASRGEASGDVARAAEDYARVLAFAREQLGPQGGPLYAAGYSFGAITAIAAAQRERGHEPALSALVLVAPPLGMLTKVELPRIELAKFVLFGECDDYLPVSAARPYFARIPRCEVTQNEADHFFAYELEEVDAFARAAVTAGV